MKRKILLILAVIFAFNYTTFSAVTQKTQGNLEQSTVNTDTDYLRGTSWQLTSIKESKFRPAITDGVSKIKINFTEDGFNGTSGVNNFFGTYALSQNGGILMSDAGITEMAGSRKMMKLESKFMKILQNVEKVRYSKNTLVLETDKGETLTFKNVTYNNSNNSSKGNIEKAISSTQWKVTNISGKKVNLKGKGITVNFDGGKISGNSGVNSYSGNYEIKNNNIRIVSELMLTAMLGSNDAMAIEEEFINILKDVKYTRLVDNNTMILSTETGATITMKKVK